MGQPADKIYYNGAIFTADATNTITEAIAFKEGKVLATGTLESLKPYLSATTEQIDLAGKMLMPGIVDSHLHPFWGGLQLSGCNLDYRSLSVEETLQFIQEYLDQDPKKGDRDWLPVRAYLRHGVLPIGYDITRRDLDQLDTVRPVILFANDCHTLVANSRALTLFGIDESTPTPKDGTIRRYPDGTLNGIMEDAPAMRAYDSIPTLDASAAITVAENVQQLLNRQGVTTVMDARALPLQFDAFTAVKAAGKLTLRLLGAREITPDDAPTVADVPRAVAEMAAFAQKYSDASWEVTPGIFIQHAKFFVDGVMQAPIHTAALLAPYRINYGTKQAPDYRLSEQTGDLYYSDQLLTALITAVSQHGFHPHMHTVGDGAIEATLNAIEKMRAEVTGDIRPSLAHNELTSPHQYARFRELGAIPCLSFQWADYPQLFADEMREILGDERFQYLETAGKFYDAGVRVAFGSDWPIDPLDEWFAFKVAVTRQGDGDDNPRLNTDRNLTLTEVLRSATIEAAYMIDADRYIGSLEPGKFADYIILDRNPFDQSPEEIGTTQVLNTFVGGEEVYRAQ
ncbi:amidohydrolase [Ignatzschineria cameli]|uniref:Amidohydrolase n=1 Tax=Ignatzschineria cameli TaxID=2182793 RepID=A0A2U2ATU3_9GAMM|nr:amidohydrolase [Ignatzschineria cameli]PWD87412.1 amidohydrolase [Ignatzschineria cameli]PWD88095.1 amidohydrolase [Ignatzschineria cameli]PWD91126.1 amidohydrolase [Ignatzschineria cameli]PWD92767.1 amidohydrolase [Ignatzschineria cameli]PWD93788.1 amidohydrolase [Ignatzschineria cameli]